MHIYLYKWTIPVQWEWTRSISKISQNIETWSKRVFNYIGFFGSSNSETHWKYMGTWQQWFWLISMVTKSSGECISLFFFSQPPVMTNFLFIDSQGSGCILYLQGGVFGQLVVYLDNLTISMNGDARAAPCPDQTVNSTVTSATCT